MQAFGATAAGDTKAPTASTCPRPSKARLSLFVLVGIFPVRAQLRILAPDALAEEFAASGGVVFGTTATFGAPRSHDRLKGRLIFGETGGRENCADGHVVSAPQARPGDRDIPRDEESATVLLVLRGGCTFVRKVQVAQEQGADAVVIVDEDLSGRMSADIQNTIMTDDGLGENISIPSMMISRSEGEKLIGAAKSGKVVVELDWDIPRGEVVRADFWMSAGSGENTGFLERFKDCAAALRFHLQFVPHYHIFQMWHTDGAETPSSHYGHLCAQRIDDCSDCIVEPGMYCAPDPDGPGPITGGDVVNEDLRQLCLWNTTVETRKFAPAASIVTVQAYDLGSYSKQFWDYVVQFREDCPLGGDGEDQRFGYKCSLQAMRKVGVDAELVHHCVRSSYRQFLEDQIHHTAWSSQALRLNGWRYSGPLDPETVLKAICSGYTKPVPVECEQLLSGYRAVAWSGFGHLGFGSLVFLSFGMVLVFTLLFKLYRRHVAICVRKTIREEVMLEVQSQMADYVPFEDSSCGRASSVGRHPLSF